MAAQDDSTAPGRRRRGRRGNREGSIYLTTDGRWRGSILLPDGTRKYLRGKTRADVQQKLRRSLDEVESTGKLVTAPQKLLLRDYLPAWLEQAKPGLRHATGLSYEQHLRLHILPALGHLRLEELEPAHVSALLARSQAAGVSATTALRIRATLRRALNDAMRNGYLARNAAALAVAPKAEPPAPVWLDAAQAEAFLNTAVGDPAGDFLALLLLLGLRSGEEFGLKWSDVDEERSIVVIRRSLQRRVGGWYEQPPKTRQSERTLPLPAQAREILARQRQRQLDQRDLAGAERLLGKGDMLVAVGGQLPERMQAALPTDADWRRIHTVEPVEMPVIAAAEHPGHALRLELEPMIEWALENGPDEEDVASATAIRKWFGVGTPTAMKVRDLARKQGYTPTPLHGERVRPALRVLSRAVGA